MKPVTPRELREAPRLDPELRPGSRSPRLALLLNPFYPKDPRRELRQARPHADARADEPRRGDAARLGGPPLGREPAPGAAAARARSRRSSGSPSTSRSPSARTSSRAGTASAAPSSSSAGCTCRPAPTRQRPHADAIADRRRRAALAADPRRRRRGARSSGATARDFTLPVPRGPAAATRPRPGRVVPHDREPHRDARLPQPLRLLLPVDARPQGAVEREGAGRRRRGVARDRASPTPSSSTTTSAPTRSTCAGSAGRSAPLERIWSAAVSIDVTDDPLLVREMALAGCTGVFVGFESLERPEPRRRRGSGPRRPPTTRAASRSSTTTASR